jgi:uncharacterized repeat protein (TIGR03803 family)
VFKTILQDDVAIVGELNGTFYGCGGCENSGRIVSLTPPAAPGGSWTETNLYQFQFVTNGEAIANVSSLIMTKGTGSLPVFYGLTTAGGSLNLGALFSLTPPASPGGAWTETDLYSFQGVGGLDSQSNPGYLVLGGNGVFYGVTQGGNQGPPSSTGNPSTVFSLTPPASPGGVWTENVLCTFASEYGDPLGGILVAKGAAGRPVIYGVNSGLAMVYELTPPPAAGDAWTQTVIYAAGGYPAGPLVMSADGILYGTTASGGQAGSGSVYSVTPPAQSGSPWTGKVIFNLPVGAIGSSPESGVVIGAGGVLYGTTSRAFGGYTGGALFSLTPPVVPGKRWTPTVLHTFSPAEPTNGTSPGEVIWIGGVLYGDTNSTVFTVVP